MGIEESGINTYQFLINVEIINENQEYNMKKTNEVIKELISRVNSTLGIFEAEWISCKRTPNSEEAEVCNTFEEFVEIRFNYECSKIPEFSKILEETDGHLFVCKWIEDVDIVKRKFSQACIEVVSLDMFEDPNEVLRSELESVVEYLGGRKIKFNSVKKKIKYSIED